MRPDGTMEGIDAGPVLFYHINWDSQQYALVGEVSNELITYANFVLVHDDKDEMAFLFNKGVKKVVPLPGWVRREQAMSIRNHPQINGIIKFPLNRKDFRK